MDELPERKESLWWLPVAPTIWAVHLLASYVLVAIWCAKVVARNGDLGGTRWAVAAFTLVALVGIVANGWYAWRRHRHGAATLPHDFDTPADRHRFLGFASVLLSALSFVGVVFVALPFIFIGSCE